MPRRDRSPGLRQDHIRRHWQPPASTGGSGPQSPGKQGCRRHEEERRGQQQRPSADQSQVHFADSKGGSPDEGGVGNIDKVRDILFGGQMRDYERRFAKLEERLARDTAELKDEVKKRSDGADRVRQERSRDARRPHQDRARRAHRRHQGAVARTPRGVQGRRQEDRAARRPDHARPAGAPAAASGSQQAAHRRDWPQSRRSAGETRAGIARAADDKADRATIAALLQEVALRLTNELTLPGAKE